MPQIVINNLSVFYKNKKTKTRIFAIDELSTTFENNKINILVGESGCGKTTLLKAIAGLVKFEGDIFYDDINAKNVSYKKLNLGFINQEFALYPHMTIFENIAYPLVNKKIDKETIFTEVQEILDLFDIKICQNRLPKDLSIGQQQRAAIARSLIKKPSLLLMDEPFSNLDNMNKEKIKNLIFNYAKNNNMTIIYVTHDIHEAILSSDYLFIMSGGKIDISGTKAEVMNSNNETVQELIRLAY